MKKDKGLPIEVKEVLYLHFHWNSAYWPKVLYSTGTFEELGGIAACYLPSGLTYEDVFKSASAERSLPPILTYGYLFKSAIAERSLLLKLTYLWKRVQIR